MGLLFITKRWHRRRFLAARWLQARLVRFIAKLDGSMRTSSEQANEQHDKARLRLEICRRCPAYNPALQICGDCGCYMPIKTQVEEAKCPQGRW